MNKYIYNNTESEKVYIGKTIDSDTYYLIPVNLEIPFSMESSLLVDISNEEIIVSTANDSSGHILNINSAIDFIKGNLPQQVKSVNFPFSDKTLSDGSKLFTRIHGVSASVQNAPNNISFEVPYAKCKITGIEILGGKVGDVVNFKILDTDEGLITGIPNYVLNQFGYSVAISKDYYKYSSDYDADLVEGLILRIEYDAVDELLPKTVYINFILHEVVE